MDREASTDLSENIQDWRRLSPIAILYFVIATLRGLLNNFVYLIPALLLGYKEVVGNPGVWLPLISGLAIFMLVMAYLSYQMYSFRLSEDSIEIRSGVLKKNHLNLPFSRIQNVSIEQPVYFRPFGYACLQLDTAGSSQQEGKLVAVSLHYAEQLKRQIMAFDKTSNTAGEAAQEGEKAGEQVLNRRSLGDLVIHGISSNRIWIFLGGLAPFYQKISAAIKDGLNKLGIDFKELFNVESHSYLEVGLYALSLVALVVLVLVSFSILGAIISYYDFTLSKSGDRYIRRSGLFTKHEVSMRLSRLQLIIRKQDWLDKVLQRFDLKFEQSNAGTKQNNQTAQQSKLIVPSITGTEAQALVNDAFTDNSLSDITYAPISTRFIRRYIAYYISPLGLLLGALAISSANYSLLGVLIAAYILSCALVVLRWKRWGFAIDQHYVYLRKGLIGTDYYLFPCYKVQQTEFSQSLMMKRRKLASVKLVLASGAISIPLISEIQATTLLDTCLFKLESSQRSWM